jgi:integrase
VNLEAFVRKHGLGNVSDSTRAVQESILRRRVYPHFTDRPIEWISEEALEAFQRELAGRVAAAYVNGVLRTLRKVLRRAVRRGILVRCPAFPRRLREKKRLAFTLAERDSFLRAFERDPDKLFLRSRELFTIAFETGLPRSDLLSLRWEEVDLEAGWIVRERQKTGVASRIPISNRCQQALEICFELGQHSEHPENHLPGCARRVEPLRKANPRPRSPWTTPLQPLQTPTPRS